MTEAHPESDPDPASLVRLLDWLSPGFPVGSFAYSHGLEAAFERGTVHDRATLHEWLEGLLTFGSARSDAAIVACAIDATASRDDEALIATATLGATFFGAPELERESIQQGNAFWRTIETSWPHPMLPRLSSILPKERIAYPVAVGVTCAVYGIGKESACAAYIHAFVANGVSAAIRLGMIGQTDGQHVVRLTEGAVLTAAAAACETRLEDVGSASLALDLFSLEHETQTTRLFRS